MNTKGLLLFADEELDDIIVSSQQVDLMKVNVEGVETDRVKAVRVSAARMRFEIV